MGVGNKQRRFYKRKLDGRTLPYCVDCDLPLARKDALRCRSCSRLGKLHWGYGIKREEFSFKGKKHSKESKLLIANAHAGKKRKPFTDEHKKNIGLAQLGRKHSEKTLRKIIKSRNIFPNRQEKYVKNLLNNLFPKKYRYVGDGSVILDGFCPDFINVNGQKKIIEFNGTYWHSNKSVIKKDKRKLKSYKNLGYKVLIIWDNELKDINKLKFKIMEFHNG